MRVTWDEAKNAVNRRKHGISFHEAGELLRSGDYLEIFDEDHSDDEERFIAIGLIGRGLILVVWTATEEDEMRIISARLATRRETQLFKTWVVGYSP